MFYILPKKTSALRRGWQQGSGGLNHPAQPLFLVRKICGGRSWTSRVGTRWRHFVIPNEMAPVLIRLRWEKKEGVVVIVSRETERRVFWRIVIEYIKNNYIINWIYIYIYIHSHTLSEWMGQDEARMSRGRIIIFALGSKHELKNKL